MYDGRAHRCVKSESDATPAGAVMAARSGATGRRDGQPIPPVPGSLAPIACETSLEGNPSIGGVFDRTSGRSEKPAQPESRAAPQTWQYVDDLAAGETAPNSGPARAEAGGDITCIAEGQHLGGPPDHSGPLQAWWPQEPVPDAPPPRPFRRPLAKDRGNTISAQRPWEAEGVSRATWYRWQKENK